MNSISLETLEITTKPQSEYPVVRPRFECGTSGIHVRHLTTRLTCSALHTEEVHDL
jgi:hypothetical protein